MARGRPPKASKIKHDKESLFEPLADPEPAIAPRQFTEAYVSSQFKPGQAGSTGKIAGLMTPNMIRRSLSKMWRMKREELQDLVHDPDTTVGDLTLAAIIVKAAGDGDTVKVNFVLDRMIGKIKPAEEKPEMLDELKNIPAEKLVALLDELPKTILNAEVNNEPPPT